MGEKTNLFVKKSGIAGRGIVRISNDAARKIGIKSGESTEILKGKKWIIATATVDKLIGKNEISVRADDMKKLNTKEGEKVTVFKHISVKTVAKKKVKGLKKTGKIAKEKIKKGAKKLSKKMKKKTKPKK